MKYRVEYWILSDECTFMDVDANNEVEAVEKAVRADILFCQLKTVTQLEDKEKDDIQKDDYIECAVCGHKTYGKRPKTG